MLSIGFVHQSGSSLPGLTFRSDEGIQEYEILCYVCVCVRACVRVCVFVCVCVWEGGCVRARERKSCVRVSVHGCEYSSTEQKGFSFLYSCLLSFAETAGDNTRLPGSQYRR